MHIRPWGVLAAVLLAILLFGLGVTLREALVVAPWADRADRGRLHMQMKNTTRFVGGSRAIRQAIWEAVHLDGASPAPSDDWTQRIRDAYTPDPTVRHVVLLPRQGESAPLWAAPGAYWATYASAPVAFLDRDALDPDTARELRRLDRPMYLLAPTGLVSDAVLEQLGQIGPVRRIAGATPIDHAVLLAEVRDVEAGFGWGRTYEQRDGYFDYVVTTTSEWSLALAGLPLARSNAATLLFISDDGSVPGIVDRYVWKQRADWFVTPAEGPFRHLWVLGDGITYASQSRLDFALEKGPYPSRGPVALGPMEGLAIVLIALGWAGGLFVLLHAWRLLPDLHPGVRVAWAFTALFAPVLGVILYLSAYRRPRATPPDEYPLFLRPGSIQAAAGTAMSFGYGAPLMVAIGYLFVWFGLPQFFGPWAAEGVGFLLGSGMVIMMFTMWLGAILVAWLAAQFPIHRALMPEHSTPRVLLRTLGMVVLSMSAVSLGMMPAVWWLQMAKFPMMPAEDDILWFGALWGGALVGFLIAWPINYALIRGRIKRGGI